MPARTRCRARSQRWARIETPHQGPHLRPPLRRRARSQRWARIETLSVKLELAALSVVVAPALSGGRGLKPRGQRGRRAVRHGVAPALSGGRGLKPYSAGAVHIKQIVAPALSGGRGLKLVVGVVEARGRRCRARSQRWARIETCGPVRASRGWSRRRARSQRWARIETPRAPRAPPRRPVAPALSGGRGLKHEGHEPPYPQRHRAHPQRWARIETQVVTPSTSP